MIKFEGNSFFDFKNYWGTNFQYLLCNAGWG